MKTAFLSDIGRKRQNNQDFVDVFTNRSGLLMGIVADGMGGHKGGDVASNMAVSHIGHDFEITKYNDLKLVKNWFNAELSKENNRIISASNQFEDLNGMGTTVVSTVIDDDQILVTNVGDSRLYLMRNNNLRQLSFDHSLVNELVRSGEISKDEAKNHPQKNIITQTLGVNKSINPESNIFKFEKDDILLLCTDGLTNMISEDFIQEVLSSNISVKEMCKKLIKKANNAGGLDNITTLIIKNDMRKGE